MNRLKGILAKLLDILSFIFFIVLILVSIVLLFFVITNFIAKKNNTTPNISLYTIVSPSMEPTIHVYDVILSVKTDDITIGDIVTFYSDSLDTGGYTITHRIYDTYIDNGVRYFITKGDNNDLPDEGVITLDNIVGKTYYIIPSLGKVQSFVSSKYGFILIILIPALIIIFLDLKKIIKVMVIRNTIIEMPKLKDVEAEKEIEENKKLRAVIDEAERINGL